MINKILLTIILLLTFGCAKNIQISNTPLIKAVESVEINNFLPEEFEKNIPKSNIILQSLVMFDNTYQRAYSDNDVVAIASNNSFATILKNNEINFTLPFCSALITKKSYNKVKINNDIAIAYGYNGIELFSITECASFANYNRNLKGDLILLKDKIIEWEGSLVSVRDYITGKEIYRSDTGINIITPGIIGEKIVLVHENNYIMSFNEKLKAFTLEGSFPLDISSMYYNSIFYGLLKSGKLFFINDKETNIKDYSNCILSNTSPYGLCGNVLVSTSKQYFNVPKSINFSISGNIYLDLKDGNLNVYYLNNSWQRFVSFGYELPIACKMKNGNIYFKSFSGDNISLIGKVEKKVKNISKSCSSKGIRLSNGKFICNNKVCGEFALEINSDKRWIMYRRIENGKRFYYFQLKKNNKK